MNAAQIKPALIRGIPLATGFWLGNKLAEAYRLSPGAGLLEKASGFSEGLTLATASLLPSLDYTDLAVGAGAACALALALSVKRSSSKKFRKGVEYGSARWGTSKDIAPFMDRNPANNLILTKTEGLSFNSRMRKWFYGRNKNVLVIGGSGSGKTQNVITPNLLQCMSEDYPTSFVVTDPKGEIVEDVGTVLRRQGYEIRIFNTIDFDKTMRYNPFAYIHSEKDILKLVECLIVNTTDKSKTGGDEFWVKAEKLLYQALIGLIYYEAPPEEQNITTMLELMDSMEVREENEEFQNAVDLLFEELEAENPRHFAVRQYKKYKMAAGKTAKSILISAAARLSAFDVQELRDLTAADDLKLDTLGDKKTALFIVISDTDDTYNFLVAMLYTQLFNLLCDKAYKVYGGRLPVHVRCLIDEAANIGQIPKLEKLMATIRSREISAVLIYQALSQLKEQYKGAADTILGNCDTTLFLGGKDGATLKELSEMLGKETIELINTGESRGRERSHSMNHQTLGKDLMTRDELAVMPGDRCIMQLRGVRPFYSHKYVLPKHPLYAQTARANPKNRFDVKAYIQEKKQGTKPWVIRDTDRFEVATITV